MRRTEFLQELKSALEGEVPSAVIQENLSYYDSYITQEKEKGRSEDDIIEELGGPRIIARTIIDSSGAGAEGGEYRQSQEVNNGSGRRGGGIRYVNLGKWYWKLLAFAIVISFLLIVMTVVGGIFALVFRFAGPLIIIWLIYSLFKGMRR